MLVNKLNIKQAWEILNFEVFENGPQTNKPYPAAIVKRRELLLLAQCYLAEYEFTKSKRYKSFFGELYRITMKTYLRWVT
jgi:hypothetical protein